MHCYSLLYQTVHELLVNAFMHTTTSIIQPAASIQLNQQYYYVNIIIHYFTVILKMTNSCLIIKNDCIMV